MLRVGFRRWQRLHQLAYAAVLVVLLAVRLVFWQRARSLHGDKSGLRRGP